MDLSNSNVQVWDCNGLATQSWVYDPTTGVIRSSASDKCLDAAAPNGNAYMGPCHSGANQRWDLLPSGEIRDRAYAQCLDIAGSNTSNGANVQMYQCSGGSNQKWSRLPLPAGTGFSFSGSSGSNLVNAGKGGSHNCFTLTGTSAPLFFESIVGDVSTLLVPAGSGCSIVALNAAVSNTPGGFQGLSARLVTYSNPTGLGKGGTQSVATLCEFNPNAAGGWTGSGTCNVTLNKTITASDQLAICFHASYATYPTTRVAWNLRCVR